MEVVVIGGRVWMIRKLIVLLLKITFSPVWLIDTIVYSLFRLLNRVLKLNMNLIEKDYSYLVYWRL